jgi:hypothetical protein
MMHKSLNSNLRLRSFFLSTLALLFALTVDVASAAPSPIEGRWDITVDMGGKPMPSWLEVRHSGYSTLVGQFTGFSGSARPISEVTFKDGKFSFSIPKQWEKGDGSLKVEGTVSGEKITGTLTTPEGKTFNYGGVRAPALRTLTEPAWGTPVKLTAGNEIKGWRPSGGKNQWIAENGILRSP